MSLLEVSELQKSYDSHMAVKSLSFSVEGGEVFGLLGPNGAGKSTTMMMLAGLLPPDAGSINLAGKPFQPRDLEMRRLLGVVPQDLAVYPDLTPRENLDFFGRLYGLNGHELQSRMDDILEQIGLVRQVDDLVKTFSGGMKRRLNFGVALMHSPRVLILDEPTVGVDPQSRSHLLDAVRRVSADGVAVLYASHYMEEVEAICNRVAIIDHGEMLALGRVDELLDKMDSDLCFRVSARPALAEKLKGLATVEVIENEDTRITLSSHHNGNTSDLTDRLMRVLEVLKQTGAELQGIETRESNLERLFLELTGRTLRD